MKKKQLTGKLYFYTEQGMEGGYLAIIDQDFIAWHVPTHALADNVQVKDNASSSKTGITSNSEILNNNSWVPQRDPILDDPLYKISSLWCGEEHGDLEADQKLMEKYNFTFIYTKDRADSLYGEGNWKFVPAYSRIQLNNGKIVILGGTPSSSPQRPYLNPTAELGRVTVKWNDGSIEKHRLSSTLFVEQWNFEGLIEIKEDDYIRVFDPYSSNVIDEGYVGKIPLKVFSQTQDGHFSKKSKNWKNYFLQGYTAEIHQ